MKTDLNVFEFWDILCECSIAERGDYIRLLYLIGMGERKMAEAAFGEYGPRVSAFYERKFNKLSDVMESVGIRDSVEEVDTRGDY